MKSFYSMMVDLTNKACLIVGGGTVAERKITALLDAAADITVVSPEFTPAISTWVVEGRIRGFCKEYESKDGEGAFLVIAATNAEKVNDNVFRNAEARGQLVNIVDRPELSSFISPSAFSRGRLKISVSTMGASPSMTREIRQELEGAFGEEYEIYLDFLHEYRIIVKENVKDIEYRQQLLKEMVHKEILSIIRKGQFEAFRIQAINRIKEFRG